MEAGHPAGRTTTIAIGSAAKTASLHNIDTRCQTRLAAAARHLKINEADLAVALSMNVTHKNIFFDKTGQAVVFDQEEQNDTGQRGD